MDNDDLLLEQAATLYRSGDYAAAFKLYKQLAVQGNVDSQAFLGSMYMYGEGTEANLSEALIWCEIAAEKGSKLAKYWAGKICLRQGKDDMAREWFARGCEDGLTQSCFWLGWLIYQGKGGKEDPERAYQLFCVAYKEGHIPSGRAKAAMLIKGYRGTAKRLYGLLLFTKVVSEAMFWAVRDPKSKRFLQ